jgi:hypothetical protein
MAFSDLPARLAPAARDLQVPRSQKTFSKQKTIKSSVHNFKIHEHGTRPSKKIDYLNISDDTFQEPDNFPVKQLTQIFLPSKKFPTKNTLHAQNFNRANNYFSVPNVTILF